MFVVVRSCADVSDFNWLGDDVSSLESGHLVFGKVELCGDRVSDDVLSLSHLLLLDRGIGSAGDVIFSKELTDG